MKTKFFKEKLFPLSDRLERPFYTLIATITYHWGQKYFCPLPYMIYDTPIGPLRTFLTHMTLLGMIVLGIGTCALDHWYLMGVT